MSNHFSAANIKSPGGDPRLDFCDLYVFAEPGDHDKTVLIMDADPFLMGSGFHPDAVYRLNIDNDGDALADAAFSFVFSPLQDGRQTVTALYTTGSQAELPDAIGEVLIEDSPVGVDAHAQPVQAGPVQMFAGVRSDPFFADADGALHGFQWTGQDTFAGKNILSIALDVPNDMLGPGPEIGVWATVSLHRDGQLVQMDRGGHPTINPFINPDDKKDEYNARQPVDDVANYLEPWSKLLEDKGGYSHDEAVAQARIVLPDILRYNRDQQATYPNGRLLTDDVYSARFAWLTNGQVGSDGLKPHDDLMPQFPFVGLPN
jgi:energy-converting hydrogenase Eha subunit F